jgi:hypothetical protein
MVLKITNFCKGERSQYFKDFNDKKYVSKNTQGFDDQLKIATKFFKEMKTQIGLSAPHRTAPLKRKANIELTNINDCCNQFKTKNDTIVLQNAEITKIIAEMEEQITNFNTAAGSAAAAKKAAAESVDALREAAKATKKAAEAKAEADRLAVQQTQLKGEVAMVTDQIKKCEESWTTLKKSAKMTGVARQVADSDALFTEIRLNFMHILKTIKDIADDLSKIKSTQTGITSKSKEINTLIQTIHRKIADAEVKVQDTSTLNKAN